MSLSSTNPQRPGYSLIAIILHWLMAAAIFVQIAMGLYMTSLTYYDPGYTLWPWWHKSIGVTVLAVLLIRIMMRLINPPPAPLATHQAWEIRSAHFVHVLLYLMIALICISGYLISTADGRGIEVFGLFTLPATITSIADQEDVAGKIHLYLSYLLLAIVGLHMAGALKHHFIDRDTTLSRMFKPTPRSKS